MRLYVPEEDSDRPAERWSDVLTTARRRRAERPIEARPSLQRRQVPWQESRLTRLGGPIVAVVIALWLTLGVWGGRPPVGADTLGHLVLAEFSTDHIFGEWQLDGWQPKFNLGYEAFLFLSSGFFWAVGAVRLLSLGLLSAAGAFKLVFVASFVALPLAVNSPFGGVGLQGLFGWGLVIQQFGAIFFFLALGSILRLVADPGPRWTIVGALTLAALVISHARSVPVLAVMLVVLFAAVRIPRAASALGIIPWDRMWREEELEAGRRGTGLDDGVPPFSGTVVRHLLAVAALAFGLACFHLLPLLAHRDLQGPLTGFGTPPFAERLMAILQGELLFRLPVALAVVAGWVFALAAMRKHRPYVPALAVTPVAYLALAHWAVRQWPGNAAVVQLPERGLGYAGVLAVLPLAVLLARLGRRWGDRGDAGALGLAAALVFISLGPAKDLARQIPDPIPQMHEAARQLTQLVPDQARFATERNPSGDVNFTSVPNPYHWLAWASGRNTLNNFGIELSPAAEPPFEPERFAAKPPDAVAETLSRLGVTHVVSLSDESAERLGNSRRLTEVWRSSPLTIFAVSASSGQPEPADLVTFDGPGRARLVGAAPNRIAIQIEPSRPTRAVLPISWSPKWHALLDGNPVDLSKASDGSIELEVPAGSSRLILEFGPDWWDRLGGAVTLAVLIGLVRRRRIRRRWPPSLRWIRRVSHPPADVEEHEKAPAVQAPVDVSLGDESVAKPPLVTVHASPSQERKPVDADSATAKAERVAQAFLGAVDASPRQKPIPGRDDAGESSRTRPDGRNLTP
ncbi:MAG: hypothetical protein M3252_04135 [Actinomycetota bacterium]|nr:hypothetical protein [Actinomycetota bacterium]